MLPLTGGAPKELLPVAGVPLIEWIARECAASGTIELLVVTAPGKDAIRERLAPRAGTPGFPLHIDFVEQPQPRGLADAIRLGRDFAAGAPLAVALPDNLFVGDAPGLAQVIETYYRTGMNVVAVVELLRADAHKSGATAVYPGTAHGDEFTIAAIPDKGSRLETFDTGDADTAVTGVGRYLFTNDVWDVIDTVERALQPGAELDDIPVLQQLLAARRLIGRRMRGQFLDVGLPAGYAEAQRIIGRPPRPSAPTGQIQ